MKRVLKHHQTGGLPEDRTLPGSKPFTVCLEFMESVTVKLMVNERAKMEVYPLILVCQVTGAVHAQVAYDHSKSAFLDQWDHFVAVHGRPSKVVSDQGGQLTSSDNTGETNSLNWEQVEGQEAERETAWEFVPTGCQWRNELTESRVEVVKATLKHMLFKTLCGEEPTRVTASSARSW